MHKTAVCLEYRVWIAIKLRGDTPRGARSPLLSCLLFTVASSSQGRNSRWPRPVFMGTAEGHRPQRPLPLPWPLGHGGLVSTLSPLGSFAPDSPHLPRRRRGGGRTGAMCSGTRGTRARGRASWTWSSRRSRGASRSSCTRPSGCRRRPRLYRPRLYRPTARRPPGRSRAHRPSRQAPPPPLATTTAGARARGASATARARRKGRRSDARRIARGRGTRANGAGDMTATTRGVPSRVLGRARGGGKGGGGPGHLAPVLLGADATGGGHRPGLVSATQGGRRRARTGAGTHREDRSTTGRIAGRGHRGIGPAAKLRHVRICTLWFADRTLHIGGFCRRVGEDATGCHIRRGGHGGKDKGVERANRGRTRERGGWIYSHEERRGEGGVLWLKESRRLRVQSYSKTKARPRARAPPSLLGMSLPFIEVVGQGGQSNRSPLLCIEPSRPSQAKSWDPPMHGLPDYGGGQQVVGPSLSRLRGRCRWPPGPRGPPRSCAAPRPRPGRPRRWP